MNSSFNQHALPLIVGGSHITPVFMAPPIEFAGQISSSVIDFVGWTKTIEKVFKQPPSECNVMLLSGAIAGMCSRTLTAPLDRIKVSIQAGFPRSHSTTSRTLIDITRSVYHDGGWKSFFRGNGVNVIKVAPETATKFFVYERCMKYLTVDSSEPSTVDRIISGSIAGLVSQSLIYPLEIAKTRFSLAPAGEYTGIVDCLRKIVYSERLSALYRGLSPSLVGIIPYAGVDLAVFNTLKYRYTSINEGKRPPVYAILSFGALSSTCGQIVSYPLQVIRTKLQAQGMNGRPIVYEGAMDCLLQTFNREGIFGLYRGMLPNFAKTVPSISITYAVYETVKSTLL